MSVADIRYERLGYVALNVSNVGRSRAFYTDFVGLADDGYGSAGKAYLRCGDQHHDILLVESGGAPGLKRIGWQLESGAAWDAAIAHFESIGLVPRVVADAETTELGVGRAFRVSEPTTGTTFEFYVDMKPAPSPYQPTVTQIMRLGHVVLDTQDQPATEEFLAEHMNFRVSDRIDGFVSFMRCFPNPYHHSFGVGASKFFDKPGQRACLNHVNFMVSDLGDIGRANNRCKNNGVPIVFGPGKHPPSESVFLYFLDPDGMTLEYSYGMEEFPEIGAREARLMPGDMSSVDYWEGHPEPAHGKVGEIEREDCSSST